MDKYDYRKAVYTAIENAIRNDGVTVDSDNAYDGWYNYLWNCDHVTGNASGSYTFSTWLAEEHLCHNTDLLEEACEALGISPADALLRGAEYCDVTIRCYLLGDILSEVLTDMDTLPF